MWADQIGSREIVDGIFGSDIPSLTDLELAQVIVEADALALALNLDRLPGTIPARWKMKGFDRAQLRFFFVVNDMLIRRGPVLGPLRVSLDLENGRLQTLSTDRSLDIVANYVASQLEIHPYRQSENEFFPMWYHR